MALRVTGGCRVRARPRHRLLFLVWERGSSVHKPAVPLHIFPAPCPFVPLATPPHSGSPNKSFSLPFVPAPGPSSRG